MKGWVHNPDYSYYFTDEGYVLTGVHEIDGKRYGFDDEGRQLFGWQEIGGKLYYFLSTTGETMKGWVHNPDYSYYFTDEGYVLTGAQETGDFFSYFDSQGRWKSSWKIESGARVFIDCQTQKIVTGWLEDEEGFKYAGEDGKVLTGLVRLGEHSYYFDAHGVRQTGWHEIDGKLYYFLSTTGESMKGWVHNADYSYYFTDEGYVLTGKQEIDGKICYFDSQGRYILPPTINNVLYTVSGMNATVTVTATTSPLAALHATAYSWDGGKTWTNEASKVFSVGTTIAAGTIQVRDTVGNITTYGSDLELTGNGPYKGIDVSAYQGVIDWAAVKESGVDFAIIRALTWSNSLNYYVIDPYFEYNVRSAKANGIDVGVYLFSYAFNVDEIREEVDFFHNSAEMKRLRADGIKFDYPVYIDFEWNTILEKTTYDQRTQIVRTGMVLLEQYGYFPGFYSSMSWALNQYDAAGLYREGYHFWCARYPANPDISAGTGSWLGFEAQMWQYASDGKVNGINGNVDMNICYVDYSSIIEGSGSSGGGSAELTLSVYDVNSGKQVTGSLESILAQVVMNEVGSWGNTEVCKAQAVAAYSWILYQQQHGNVIPSVGLATPTQTVKNAVKEVVGQALYYNGSVANAAYGSASAAYTNTAQAMWGLNLPYLNTPVSSPETAYRGKTTTVQLSTMQSNITKIVGASLANSTPHSQWITDPVFDSNGYLTSIKVCGRTVSAGMFYENCWGLYSPNFTMTYNASSDSWTFVTNGNGHCVGMSQYGAYWYAVNQGWNYQQILLHYFPGTIIK